MRGLFWRGMAGVGERAEAVSLHNSTQALRSQDVEQIRAALPWTIDDVRQ